MTSTGMTEADISSAASIVFCEEGGRIWRNNIVEMAYVKVGKEYRPVGKCGFGPGSADRIGVMLGRFFGIEVKKPGKNPREDQWRWLRMVADVGGVAIVCRSAEGLRDLLRRFKAGTLAEGVVHEC